MDHSTGTYVSAQLSKQSKALLDAWVEDILQIKNPVDPATYHTTIIYSPTPVPQAELLSKDEVFIASPKEYRIFPTKQGGNCLVLIVESDQLKFLNTKLTFWGATSTYSVYHPHITLAYEYTGDIPSKLPEFDISYDGLTISPLDLDYVPPNKR